MAYNIFLLLGALVAQQCSAAPVELPNSLSLADIPTLTLPTALPTFTLPTNVPTLTFSTLPSLTGTLSIPSPTFTPFDVKRMDLPLALPTDFSTLTLSIPTTLPTLVIPTALPTLSIALSEFMKKHAAETGSVPIATATGLPTGLFLGPPPLAPTGAHTGRPSGVPTGLPVPSGLRAIPGGLMRPGRN